MSNSESGPSSTDELANMFGAQNLSLTPLTIRNFPLSSNRPQEQREDSTEKGKWKGKQKETVQEKNNDELEEVEIMLNSTTDKDKHDRARIFNNATSLKVGDTAPLRSGVTKASPTFTKMSTEWIPSPLDFNSVARNPISYRLRSMNIYTGRPDYFSWKEKPKPKRVHYKSSRSLRGMTESHATEQGSTTSEQRARRMAASAKIRGVRRRGRPDPLDVTEGLYSTIITSTYGSRRPDIPAMSEGESSTHNVPVHLPTKASWTTQDHDDLPSYEEVEKEFASATYAVIPAPKPAPKAESSRAAAPNHTSVPKRPQQPISSLSFVHASGSSTPASTVRTEATPSSRYARGSVAPSALSRVGIQTGGTERAPQMAVSTFIRAGSDSSTLFSSGADMDGAEQPTASSSRSSNIPVPKGTVPALQRTSLGKSDTMMSVVDMDTDTTMVDIHLPKLAGRRLGITSSLMSVDDPIDTRSGRPSMSIINEDSEMTISEVPSRSQTMSVTMIDVRDTDMDIDIDMNIQPASVKTLDAGSSRALGIANRATHSANFTAEPRGTTSNVARWAPQNILAPAPPSAFVPSFASPFVPSSHPQAPQQPPKILVLGLNESLHLPEATAQRVFNRPQYPSNSIPLPADPVPPSQTYPLSPHRTSLPESVPSQEPFWDQVHNMASSGSYHPLNFGSFSSSPSQEIARGNKRQSRRDSNVLINGVKFTRQMKIQKWKNGYWKNSSHISSRDVKGRGKNSTAAAAESLPSVPLISFSPPQPRLWRGHEQEYSDSSRFSCLRHIPFSSARITLSLPGHGEDITGSTRSSGNRQNRRERSCGWILGYLRSSVETQRSESITINFGRKLQSRSEPG